jgi:hypothetical protein
LAIYEGLIDFRYLFNFVLIKNPTLEGRPVARF